jgi:beta-lactamase class A
MSDLYFSRRSSFNKKVLKTFLFIFITLILFCAGTLLLVGERGLISPSNILGETKKPDSNLAEVVNNSLIGTQGIYAIYIKNLSTGEFYATREHQQFEAGSLYKLWIMATAVKQIEGGNLSEDQELSEDVVTLNRKFGIDPDYAELTGGTVDLTVGSALNQMITISHNYAALLLTDRVKLSNVAKFLQGSGFKESVVGVEGDSPKTTASDIGQFLEKLYKGELGSPENTQKMLNFLKAQKLNDKLPKYLPKGTVIAHKTGEIDTLSHDGGIVFTEKGDYIIVVLSESNYPPGAEERIALISKSVFDYFTQAR